MMNDRGEGPGLAQPEARPRGLRVLGWTAMGLAAGTVFALSCGAGTQLMAACMQIACTLAGFAVGLRTSARRHGAED